MCGVGHPVHFSQSSLCRLYSNISVWYSSNPPIKFSLILTMETHLISEKLKMSASNKGKGGSFSSPCFFNFRYSIYNIVPRKPKQIILMNEYTSSATSENFRSTCQSLQLARKLEKNFPQTGLAIGYYLLMTHLGMPSEKIEKTFRHMSKFQQTPPSLPHF